MTDIRIEPPRAAMATATDLKHVAFPRVDATLTRPSAPVARAGDVQFRLHPYEYGGKNTGNAFMDPDPVSGKIALAGRTGHIVDGQDGLVSGIAWVGTSVFFPDTTRRVLVSPIINWTAGWRLGTAGVPEALVGADPKAAVRMGVQVQAYDTQGPVSRLDQRELVNDRFQELGLPDPRDGWADGVSQDMSVWFAVPAGQPRWVNVLAYLDINAEYSPTFNVAFAAASLVADVRWIVIDPE